MQKIVDLVLKYKEYITLISLVVISMSLISMGDVSRIGGFRTVVIASIGWVQEAFAWIPNPGALKNENKALRQLNLQLSSEVTRMRKSLIENHNLRDMLDLKNHLEHKYLTCEIVGRTTIQMRNYFMLDKGKNENILPGMCIRNAHGLIGQIVGASDNYSLVESIKNREVKIAAKVQRSAVDGILIWDGGFDFLLKNIPKSFDVQVGDIIVTSNYSNKYPADIPIGEIASLSDEPGDLFLKIVVKPAVNFSSVEQAFIIKYLPDPERQKLIDEIDEIIKARKNIHQRK